MPNNSNESRRRQELVDEPIAVLEEYGLSVRSITVLENQCNIVYMRDLLKLSKEELLSKPEVKETICKEIENSIRSFLQSV
jgi:DNA-directed RNA polymerase alpha subunit